MTSDSASGSPASSALARLRRRRADSEASSPASSRAGSTAGIMKMYSLDDTPGIKRPHHCAGFEFDLHRLRSIVAHLGPFYARLPAQQHIQTEFLAEVMTRTAKRLFKENSLIRDIKYMGTQQLPYRMKLSGEYHTAGSYWVMYFYGGPQSVKRLRKELEADTDIIRSTFTKQGDKLKDYVFS